MNAREIFANRAVCAHVNPQSSSRTERVNMNKYGTKFFAVISVLVLVGLIGTAAEETDQP